MIAAPPVGQSWQYIEDWLARHAPASHQTLRRGANPGLVKSHFKRLGIPLSRDLYDLLVLHDGATETGPDGEFWQGARFLPDNQTLFCLKEIEKTQQRHRSGVNSYPPDMAEAMIGDWWHPQWVAFADYITGDAWIIDQRPGPDQGAIGRWNKVFGGRFQTWPSLAAMLADIADALEHQRPIRHEHPTVVDGMLQWH